MGPKPCGQRCCCCLWWGISAHLHHWHGQRRWTCGHLFRYSMFHYSLLISVHVKFNLKTGIVKRAICSFFFVYCDLQIQGNSRKGFGRCLFSCLLHYVHYLSIPLHTNSWDDISRTLFVNFQILNIFLDDSLELLTFLQRTYCSLHDEVYLKEEKVYFSVDERFVTAVSTYKELWLYISCV